MLDVVWNISCLSYSVKQPKENFSECHIQPLCPVDSLRCPQDIKKHVHEKHVSQHDNSVTQNVCCVLLCSQQVANHIHFHQNPNNKSGTVILNMFELRNIEIIVTFSSGDCEGGRWNLNKQFFSSKFHFSESLMLSHIRFIHG